MKLQRLLGALCAVLLLALPARAAEQASYVTPITGPMNMATFAGTYLNPGLRALATCSWGTSAPLNGPSSAALPYQCWADTTTNPVVFKVYDGASWVVTAKLNTSGHTWTPSYQGTDLGTASIATTGTSGHTLGFLDGANTYSGIQSGATAAVDTNTTQFASTAFVLAQAASATPLIDGSAAVGTSTRFARGDHIHPTDTTRAALASPTFTGTPAAPTAAVDTNTTQVATTAYVIGQAASATPLIDGTAAAGSSTRFARGDHIHPTDTTRAPTAAPTFTGLVDVSGALKLSTQSAPAQITSNQNNYNPSSVVCASSATLLINSDAARDITGLAGGVTGCATVLINNGSFAITLKDESSSSTAANRFGFGGDLPLASKQAVTLLYDSSASRWRQIGGPSATGGGGGTMTQVTAGGNCVSGTTGQSAITTSGTIDCRADNVLRNSTMTSWFHGIGTLTITTSGGWCAEGLYVVPTGASVTCGENTNGLTNPLTVWSMKIIGNTSVTDVTVRFVVESYDAAPLAGQQVTCQFPVLNNTGGSITPTLTVKRANTQDATYTNTDVSAVSLQTITNGSTGTLAYSWAANASSFNGLSIDVDFGNNFSTNGKTVQIGGGFDCHVTPGVSTGTVANPPAPRIIPAMLDMAWNKRFFETSYSNGTSPGTSTQVGMVQGQASGFASSVSNTGHGIIRFQAEKRAVPTMAFYDGAGTINNYTTDSNGTLTNGVSAGSPAFSSIGTNNALWYQNNTGLNTLIHYTADAAPTGG